MAVENLLQRCTSKHGSRLKHTETKNIESESSSTGEGDNSLDKTATGKGTGKGKNKTNGKREDVIGAKGRKAMNDLDVNAAYCIDFIAITKDRQKMLKEQNRSHDKDDKK